MLRQTYWMKLLWVTFWKKNIQPFSKFILNSHSGLGSSSLLFRVVLLYLAALLAKSLNQSHWYTMEIAMPPPNDRILLLKKLTHTSFVREQLKRLSHVENTYYQLSHKAFEHHLRTLKHGFSSQVKKSCQVAETGYKKAHEYDFRSYDFQQCSNSIWGTSGVTFIWEGNLKSDLIIWTKKRKEKKSASGKWKEEWTKHRRGTRMSLFIRTRELQVAGGGAQLGRPDKWCRCAECSQRWLQGNCKTHTQAERKTQWPV